MTVEDSKPEILESKSQDFSENVKPFVISLEILNVIKNAQQQHGLRHGDYQRYRGYCSRRIRRLRKVLDVKNNHRSRRFVLNEITEDKIKDERLLHIVLMQAERAWAYAMQLRQEANTEPRKRFHQIHRLRKSTVHAQKLQTLCESPICDLRSRLEAQAYLSWLIGSLHFELQLWPSAKENLSKAQIVYEKLAEVVSEVDQSLYRSKVDELKPSIRYCSYSIGEEASVDDILTLRNQSDLLSNFDLLLEQRKKEEGSAGDKPLEINWKGLKVFVRNLRARRYVLADGQLNTAVEKATTIADKLRLIEDNLLDCKDAIASVRDDIANDPASKVAKESGSPSQLQQLLTYLIAQRLQRTIERNLLMALQIKGDPKKQRPQDLARIYEMILQNLAELQSVPGLENIEKHREEVTSRIICYKAFRSFYIAEYAGTLKRWQEAFALYERAQHYIDSCPVVHQGELKELKVELEKAKLTAHAHSVLDSEQPSDSEATISGKLYKPKKPLIERLDEYREDPSLLSKQPNVAKIPPEMKPVPCKPLFFDLALNLVEFPNLEHKFDPQGKRQNAAGITGLVKGFLGWGSSK